MCPLTDAYGMPTPATVTFAVATVVLDDGGASATAGGAIRMQQLPMQSAVALVQVRRAAVTSPLPTPPLL